MSRDGVAVHPAVAAAVFAKSRGEKVNVAALCREVELSPKTFYKYLARFEVMGLEGFFPQSRRPHHSPARTPVEVEDEIARARKELADDGWDYGAISIGYRLEEVLDDASMVPSRATIHRILVRRGLVVPQPAKRPRRITRRFARERANELWQLDGWDYVLADGTVVVVLSLVDDHSRLDLADYAAVSENGADTWKCFCLATTRYGLPAELVSDNGGAFTGKRRGFTTAFETSLLALGVLQIASSVGHPQTCGKNERSHRTAQQWLEARPPAATLEELQALLDQYRTGYNNRRHQGLNGLTPQQKFDLAEKTGPAGQPLTAPPIVSNPTVSPRGAIGVDNTEIGLGRRYAGTTVTVFRTGNTVAVFHGDHLIRDLTIDRTRRYQPHPTNPKPSPMS
jgi:transposase InsO family protein